MQLIHETRSQVRRDRLLRLPEVEAAIGFKKSTIYLLMRRDEFPRCVRLTARSVAWPESQVLQWVQDRIAAAATPLRRPAVPGCSATAEGGQQ